MIVGSVGSSSPELHGRAIRGPQGKPGGARWRESPDLRRGGRTGLRWQQTGQKKPSGQRQFTGGGRSSRAEMKKILQTFHNTGANDGRVPVCYMAGPSEALRGSPEERGGGRVRISGEEGAQGSVGSSGPGNKNPGAETVTGGTTILLKKRDSSLSLHNRLTKAQRVPQERAMRGPKFMTRSLLHRAMK